MNRWSQRYQFWKALSPASHATFLTGVFFMFLPVGLLFDISKLGAEPVSRLVANMLFGAVLASAYVVVVRRPRWLPLLIAIHILVTVQFDRLFGPATTPLTGDALQNRLQADANIMVVSIIVSFVLLSNFVQRQGARYVRARTEIELARDIHRLLVPPIARRIGRFEFHGVSLPSGDVGGDLIDLVESEGRWIGYVADVSGHGVGSGLLMGMVKSAARMKLQAPQPPRLDQLLDTLNVVLLDLKKPEMYVTFAGLQFDGTPELQFSVAGHLPILHYRSQSSTIDELSVAQVPLAMFDDRSFSASRVAWAPGDLFVILTDGLTEVFDRQDREFGLDRIKDMIRTHARESLQSLEEQLIAAVRNHGPQLDDQTLLSIKVVE